MVAESPGNEFCRHFSAIRKKNINAKLATFQPVTGGFVDKVERIVGRISLQLDKQAASREPQGLRSRAPLPVKIIDDDSPFEYPAL